MPSAISKIVFMKLLDNIIMIHSFILQGNFTDQ